MDEVAGPKVYVLRTGVPDNPAQWQERAYSEYNRSRFGARLYGPPKFTNEPYEIVKQIQVSPSAQTVPTLASFELRA